jgi:hypothetical protein
MGAERFIISKVNPNDTSGGGGCACSEVKHVDARGPYAVFPHQECSNNLSPHLVVCAPCLQAAVTDIEFGEVLYAGQREGEDGNTSA